MIKKATGEKKEPKSVGRAGLMFVLPGFLLQLIFGWYPLLLGFLVAVRGFEIVRPSTYVGLQNFRIIFADPMLPIIFRNTFYYAGLTLALTFLLPIFISILLMEMRKNLIRTMMILWFIPTSGMAGIIIWKWFYDPHFGLFNAILTNVGLPTLKWLNDPSLAMLCLVLPGFLMFGPGLIYIASIQGIPDELYEAAELEGTGLWKKIWLITLPRLRPIIAVMLVLGVIGAMQVFTQPLVMTGGGPGNATISVVMYIYTLGFGSLFFGRATALAIVLFTILMIITVIQRRFFKENIDK